MDEGGRPSKTTELEPSNDVVCDILPPIKGRRGQNNSTCYGAVDEEQEGEEEQSSVFVSVFPAGSLVSNLTWK